MLSKAMYDTVVNKLVKVMGPDVYFACPSIAASENLSPGSLVERKASRWCFGSNSYYPHGFQMKDIVEGDGFDVRLKEDNTSFVGYSQTVVIKIQGKLTGNFKDVFASELEGVKSITVKAELGQLCISELDEQHLLDSVKGRKIDVSHQLIKELMSKKRRAICVVIGVVKTTQVVKVTANIEWEADASAKVKTPLETSSISGSGKADGDNDREMDLPAGTILAYQVCELAVSDEGNFEVLVSHGAEGGFHEHVDEVDSVLPREPKPVTVDLTLLKQTFAGFGKLTPDTRRDLVDGVLKTCDNRNELDELAKLLKFSESESATPDVQAVLDLVTGHREDEAILSLQNLCRCLRNLDPEELNRLSEVPLDSIELLRSVLSSTWEGSESESVTDVSKFATEHLKALEFLVVGCEYVIDSSGLHPPKGNTRGLLRDAYIAVCGLSSCLVV